jgi:hypothetical protein
LNLKITNTFLGAVLSIVVAVHSGCASIGRRQGTLSEGRALKLWHRNNQELAGVVIYRNDPVNMAGDLPRKASDHPWGISYYFWSRPQIHYVWYDKYGNVLRDKWDERAAPPTHKEWKRVDFSYGSDPFLERHPDPRFKALD